MPRYLAAVAVIVLGLGGAAAAAPLPITPGDVSFIQEGHAYVLRSNESLPLYTFDKDVAGRSNCTGPCEAIWPPLIASAGSTPLGEWTLARRADGKSQWVWRGRPVYTHAGDGPERPTGVGGAWHVLPPIAK